MENSRGVGNPRAQLWGPLALLLLPALRMVLSTPNPYIFCGGLPLVRFQPAARLFPSKPLLLCDGIQWTQQ